MATAGGDAAGESIVLEEEIDPNYEPTPEEVEEYARWLGMDPVHDRDLLWVAREGLKVRTGLSKTPQCLAVLSVE